jgi:hypothetical protein
MIEIIDILLNDCSDLLIRYKQEMIQSFSPDTSNYSFRIGVNVRSRCADIYPLDVIPTIIDRRKSR